MKLPGRNIYLNISWLWFNISPITEDPQLDLKNRSFYFMQTELYVGINSTVWNIWFYKNLCVLCQNILCMPFLKNPLFTGLYQFCHLCTSFSIDSSVLQLKLKALILDIIHNIGVVKQLNQTGVTSPEAWGWKKQLRFYMGPDKCCYTHMVNTEFSYTYEYQVSCHIFINSPFLYWLETFKHINIQYTDVSRSAINFYFWRFYSD